MVSRIEKKLNRQIQRYLAVDDNFMNDLEELGGCLESNDIKSEKIVKILTGFPEFLSSVLNVYDQYEDKNKMALHNLDVSSRELNESNNNLEVLIGSMRAVLESLGPALMFFNKEGVCGSFYSKSCLTLLECNPDGEAVWDVLKFSEEETESFKSLVEFSYNNNSAMSFDDIFEMAPKEYTYAKNKHISLFYKPIIGVNGELNNVLVMAVDKTDEVNAQKTIKEKQAYSEKIIRIAHAKNDYIQVLQSIQDYFLNDGFNQELSVENIIENIHTLKGLAGSFHVSNIIDIIHELEEYNKLFSPDFKSFNDEIKKHKQRIKGYLDSEISFSENIFGKNILEQGNSTSLKYEKLFKFYNDLKKEKSPLSERFFTEYLTVNIFESLSILDFHLIEASKILDKKVYPCKFEGDNVKIPIKKYDELISSFVHFIRNAVDHGIERPEERLDLNKDEFAQITIKVKSFNKNNTPWLRISFADDGRGIDANKIKRKLDALNIDSSEFSEEEILMFVFKADLSTMNRASHMSGRGIGLSAVKKNIDRLNGNVSIVTKLGVGTTFDVEFPVESK